MCKVKILKLNIENLVMIVIKHLEIDIPLLLKL